MKCKFLPERTDHLSILFDTDFSFVLFDLCIDGLSQRKCKFLPERTDHQSILFDTDFSFVLFDLCIDSLSQRKCKFLPERTDHEPSSLILISLCSLCFML